MRNSAVTEIGDMLAEDPVCYVLVTCSCPADDGQMQVKMIYEGDELLASYLLQGAKKIIEEKDDEKDV